jgi:GGDEF domain-containing protein
LESDDQEHRKKFMETLMESVLAEELAGTLNITNLLANPKAFTRMMIETDLAGDQQFAASQEGPASHPAGAKASSRVSAGIAEPAQGPSDVIHPEKAAADAATTTGFSGPPAPAAMHSSLSDGPAEALERGVGGPRELPDPSGEEAQAATGPDAATGAPAAGSRGVLLLHQIELMHQEVEKQLQGQGEVSLTDLTHSIFEMKKQLLESLQAQKALGAAYANESAIVAAADKLTDQVMIELIKEEYQAGAVSPKRLAHLIVRLIPEANELRRLLPQIKRCLLQQGMAPSDYLNLIEILREELQGEELTRILQESSEAIGLDSDMLIEEVKNNPVQAAELLYLASEIRKSSADENALSDILVEYVERVGDQIAKKTGESGQGADHIKQVINDVESTLLKKLSGMNVNTTLLKRMEERLNARMESIIDNMRVQWIQHHSTGAKEKIKLLSVLETLENNVGADEDLSAVLKAVRGKVDEGEIEENNFVQIHEEIMHQLKLRKAWEEGLDTVENLLTSDEIMFILEKEIARSTRYGSPFVILAFAFVKAKPNSPLQEEISSKDILTAALKRLSGSFRTADFVGRIGKNKILVLLPMAIAEQGKKTLIRVLRLVHAAPLDVGGVSIQLRVAGVTSEFDAEKMPDAKTVVKHLSQELTGMVTRIKSIQVLF